MGIVERRGRRSGNPFRPSQQKRYWSHFQRDSASGQTSTRWEWREPARGWRERPSEEGYRVQTWHWQPANTEGEVPHPVHPPAAPEENRVVTETEVVLNPHRPEEGHQPLRRASDIRPQPYRPGSARRRHRDQDPVRIILRRGLQQLRGEQRYQRLRQR